MSALFLVFALFFVSAVSTAENVGYFWHVTDTHLLRGYTEGAATENHCLKNGPGLSGTPAGRFGDYSCDTPAVTLASAWEQLASLSKAVSPDFVLYTGDHTSLQDPKVSEEDTRFFIENVSAALAQLQHTLEEQQGRTVPVYPMIGNHDSYPAFQFPPLGPFHAYDSAATSFARFLDPTSVATMKKGMYYTTLIAPRLRLVVFNSLAYYIYNRMVDTSDRDPGGHLAWLRETLNSARARRELVVLASHIPPGYDEYEVQQQSHAALNDLLADTLAEYQGNPIVAGFYGHNHIVSFRLMRASDTDPKSGDAASVIFTSGAVSPLIENPSVTLFKYSRDYPFTILDQTVYFFGLFRHSRDSFVIVIMRVCTMEQILSKPTERGGLSGRKLSRQRGITV